MADSELPSESHHGLVSPIKAWLNSGVRVKPMSQLINRLVVVVLPM